jgi:predicted transposase/invertase (TIGR01784 family)
MKRDSLFYRIFQQNPMLLFDLLQSHPTNASDYQFDSVEIKQTSFRIDGVFLPPDASGITYLVEVQFQPDEVLYERVMSEGSLYFYRNRDRCRDYRLVVVYPSRDLEQKDLEPHQFLISTGKLTRIYLDELGDVSQLPIGLSLMVLTTLENDEAKRVARQLADRAMEEPESRAIMDILSTILIYKFTDLSRDEVTAMLASSIEESLAYRQIRDESILRGTQEMIVRQLRQRLGTEVQAEWVQRIGKLSIEQVEQLSIALLDFSAVADLVDWLDLQAGRD